MASEERLNDYDSEPVRYCSKCYSLKIKYDESIDDDYCVDCGCTDISESSISNWERLYEKRYGHKFTQKKYTAKDSSIYKMSLADLKVLVAKSDIWRFAINKMYPRIPTTNKAEAIILLFNRAIDDNRIDELKMLLIDKLEK